MKGGPSSHVVLAERMSDELNGEVSTASADLPFGEESFSLYTCLAVENTGEEEEEEEERAK